MSAKELRKMLQTNAQELMSDWTREDLAHQLKRTRSHNGGLSLMEIAEVIQENLAPEEVAQLKNNL